MEDLTSSLQKQTPAWLKHLQENSWEAEILISGGAIYSLFQLADGIVSAGEYMKEVSPFTGLNLTLLVGMIMLRGVTIGFILHLLLRGLWIALVCLNSVYPNGIRFERLNIKGRYLEAAKKTTLTERIIRLDELSGLIFFGAFLFILILPGVVIVLVSMAAVGVLLGSYYFWYDVTSFIYSLLAVIFYLDMLSSGILRRNKLVGKVYLPVYLFFDVLTLGFLYRPLLQVVSTNISKWKAGLLILVMLAGSLLFAYTSLQSVLLYGNVFDQRSYPSTAGQGFAIDIFYLDQLPANRPVWRACIQSDFVKDDYLRVFIPYKARYNYRVKEHGVFSKIITVSVNDSLYQNIDWLAYERQQSGQRGVIAYLPILHLPKGKNELGVRIEGEKFFRSQQDVIVIPFWKE